MAIDTYYNDSDLPNCNRNDAIESYKALEPLENYVPNKIYCSAADIVVDSTFRSLFRRGLCPEDSVSP